MRPTLLRIAAILAVIPLTLATTARAADDPPPFGESIDVRVVNLEAVVTDRSGKRVTGLEAGDFRLRVDGKEVPVEYFTEVQDGNALPPPAAERAPKTETAVQGLTEGPVGTYYLVFIDDYFSVASNRDVVLKGLKGDLGRLGPNDRMAIVAYDGGRLAMLSNWSGSQADLAKAFDQAMTRKTHGFDRIIESRTLAHDLSFASQTVGDGAPLDLNTRGGGLNDQQRAYASTLIRQVEGDVQAAVSTMRAFAAPRGRKVMLLLSGGWPFSAQSFTSGNGGLPTRELADGEKVFGPLAATANLLGYTLYPIDVPGVQTGAADAEAAGPASAAFNSDAEQEIEGSLKFLAKETGGEPILNSNRGLALAMSRDDTRSFYWLGFSPSWQHNDKTHDVKLEVRRSDLRIRSRTGFLDLSRKAEVTMKVESALLFGSPPGALTMPLKLGEIARSRGRETEIPITLGLPVDLMTVVPSGKKFTAQLELRFAASDAAGNTAEIPIVPVTLTSDHPPTPGKVVKYETKIKLRGKADHMVVAAYDALSGKIATAETDLKLP